MKFTRRGAVLLGSACSKSGWRGAGCGILVFAVDEDDLASNEARELLGRTCCGCILPISGASPKLWARTLLRAQYGTKPITQVNWWLRVVASGHRYGCVIAHRNFNSTRNEDTDGGWSAHAESWFGD